MGMSNFSGSSGSNASIANMIASATGQGNVDATEFLINYNAKFAAGGFAMFRDAVVEQTMSILIGKNKPNALLVGQAGVGKTKVVEDIAYRIASKNASVPARLANATVYELPLATIVAGSGIVGSLEEKVKAVVDFASDKANDAILFIDEIHQLTGDAQVYGRIAQILKPAMARGDIRVIGATTTQEATSLIDDPAFNRRFSRVIVDELTREQTIAVLEQAAPGFIRHYGNRIVIDEDTLSLTAVVADRYSAAGNHRPDTALTLLDRACADALVSRQKLEANLCADIDPTKRQTGNQLRAQCVTLTESRLRATALLMTTGHAKHEKLDAVALNAKLSRIKGQDDVIAEIVERLRRNDMTLYPKTRPLTFLFAGASGVGKTEVTKIIAEELTGVAPITLNMTEYHSPASINRIIGSPAGYVGSDSKRELPFDCLEANPYQVILLDEFEKADKAVQRLFMGAFDEGSIKCANGRTVDFSKAIIIATTNASHSAGKKGSVGFVPSAGAKHSDADTVKGLSSWFDTELLNRFSKILTFNRLSREDYRDIVADIYARDIARIKSENPRVTLPDELDEDTLSILVEDSYIADFGARPARKCVQDYIEASV